MELRHHNSGTPPRLSSLPSEILLAISSSLSVEDIHRLIQASWHYYNILSDELYKRDAVNPLGSRALRFGCTYGRAATIKLAAVEGIANIRRSQETEPDYATPMTIAVNGEAPWIAVPALLSLGANPNGMIASQRHCDIEKFDNYAAPARTVPLIVIIERMKRPTETAMGMQMNTLLMRTIRELLRHGADPNCVAFPIIVRHSYKRVDRRTYAMTRVHKPMNLLSAPQPTSRPLSPEQYANLPDSEPWNLGCYTALAAATAIADWDEELCAELLSLLVEHGANPNGNEAAVLPLDRDHSYGIVDYWMEQEMFAKITNHVTPMQASFFRIQHDFLISLLLTLGADVNYRKPVPDWCVPKSRNRNNRYFTPLNSTGPDEVPPLGTDPRVQHPSVDMAPLEALLRWCRRCASPLGYRLQQNAPAIARQLLQAGANPNATTDPLYGLRAREARRTWWSAKHMDGFLDEATQLLQVPYLAEIFYTWPIVESLRPLLIDMIAVLLQHGADATQEFPYTDGPPILQGELTWAYSAVFILMRNKNNIGEETECQLLQHILAHTNKEQLPRARLLFCAELYLKPHLVPVVMQHGGDPDCISEPFPRDNLVSTLHHAVECMNTPMVEACLKVGANPNIRDFQHRRPRDYCIEIIMLVLRVEAVRASRIPGCPAWSEWRNSSLFLKGLRMLHLLYCAGADTELDDKMLGMLPPGVCHVCLGDVEYQDEPLITSSGADVNTESETESDSSDDGLDLDGDTFHVFHDNDDEQDKPDVPTRCVCVVKLETQLNGPSREETEEATVGKYEHISSMISANLRQFWRDKYLTAIRDAGPTWWVSWHWRFPSL